VCGRQLLALPAERPGQPEPRRADRIARRLRALAPAAGAAGVAVLVLAVVASAFAAGRLTRTTPQAPAAATATTSPRFLDEGPETGRRDLNWEAQASGLTVRLRSLTVGSGFTRLELHVDGVRQGCGSATTTATTCCPAASWPASPPRPAGRRAAPASTPRSCSTGPSTSRPWPAWSCAG
jgi:hypothetical protein